MAPTPDDNRATAAAAVADANDALSSSSLPKPALLPTLVSDPRTAFSALKGRREGSCQTATKSCDSRQVDIFDILYFSFLSLIDKHFTLVHFLALHRASLPGNLIRTGWPIWSRTWAELTLISVSLHLATCQAASA